jgi:sugar phosphate isomerase/epimerase
MSKIPIALQLWSVRDDVAKDLPGTLAALANMGYQGVETAGLGSTAPAEWKKLLKDNGLGVAGAHVGINLVEEGALQSTIDTYAALGCTRLVVPALPGDMRSSLDGYRRACAILNVAAEKAAKQGIELGYHNHDFEFKFIENRVPYNLMLDCLTSQVFLQFDFGWVYRGGADGAAYTRAFPDREKTVHIKAYKADNDTAVVGEDSVPWKDVFAACESVGGTQWYIVEHERYANPPMVCVKQCLDNLRAMGK